MNVNALKEEKWQHKGSSDCWRPKWDVMAAWYLKQQVLSSGSYLLYQKQFKMNNE